MARESQAPIGRRERAKQEKRKRIVAAARALFAEKGFDATTTQEVAERADVGAGTVFRYAKVKDDLLILVFREEMGEVADTAYETRPSAKPLLAQLLHFFDAMASHHAKDEHTARLLLRHLGFAANEACRAEVGELMHGIYSHLADMVSEAQARGELDPRMAPYTLGRNLFSIYYGLMIEWIGGYTTRKQYERALKASLSLQLDGARAHQSKPPRKKSEKTTRSGRKEKCQLAQEPSF